MNNERKAGYLMTEYLWDGEMDCGWEELEEKVNATASLFYDKMLEIVQYSPYEKSRELINQESMARFVDIARVMSEKLEMGYYYEYEDIENKNCNAYKLTTWILLGSLTESVLQMFLAFYINDYEHSKWQQWEEIKEDEIKKPIIDAINNLVDGESISRDQGKSLKEAIKRKIKEHTVEHPVQKIMLDEIIKYYTAMELMDEDELDYLKTIQSNRNGIHSFENRTIGTWSDLQYSVRFWCYLLEWILNRLPEVPDYS